MRTPVVMTPTGTDTTAFVALVVLSWMRSAHTCAFAAEGNGPVNAMDSALRKALEKFYPELSEIRLLDYKVRVLSGGGTGATVRVLIQSGDKDAVWGTVGVSHNIIEGQPVAASARKQHPGHLFLAQFPEGLHHLFAFIRAVPQQQCLLQAFFAVTARDIN